MECPVCNRAFPQTEINKHVNVCLNLKEDDQCTSGANGGRIPNRKSIKTNVVNDVPTKRKSSSNWGSLQPMRKSNLTDSVKKPDKTFGDKGSKVVTSRPEGAKGKTNDMINHEFCSLPKNDLLMQSLAAAELESLQDQPVQRLANRNSEPSKSNSHSKADSFAPLAERVRPKELENYVGQDKVVGKESMLYSLLQSDHIPSIILWGPPGCGKTTLARIIANNCRSRGNAKFVSLSAAACGVNEVKDVIKIARNDQKMFHKKTVMFLDEIHRFNKMQQDVLLPHVEDGTVTLIGATTENPSFQVNSALLSRCRVIVLDKLSGENVLNILQKALPYTGAVLLKPDQHSETDRAETDVYIDSKALEVLANLVDGDARAALNGLQMAVESKGPNSRGIKGSNFARKMKMDSGSCGKHIVTVEDIKEGLQRSHVLYDKAGEEHYNIISALHKSMRGSDASASLYWLARMLEGGENPLYIARRLIRFASEDIGLADPMALTQAVSAYQGCHLIGMPECDVLLAQCVVYLARAPKSVEILQAYGKAKTCIRQHKGPLPSVPLHLRNAPTALMKDLGYGKDYKYNPSYEEPVDQDYFPSELVGTDFFT